MQLVFAAKADSFKEDTVLYGFFPRTTYSGTFYLVRLMKRIEYLF
jgi:hypothetical protein